MGLACKVTGFERKLCRALGGGGCPRYVLLARHDECIPPTPIYLTNVNCPSIVLLILYCTVYPFPHRYVAVTLEPVTNHLLLQLAAYVALLVASKMSEVSPLRMKSLANLTGRMFTPIQVRFLCTFDSRRLFLCSRAILWILAHKRLSLSDLPTHHQYLKFSRVLLLV